MNINAKDYPLREENYFGKTYVKKQIVLANTYAKNMNHYSGWMLRNAGKYTRTAPFTITKDGDVMEHFKPEFYSTFFNHEMLDKHIIPILLENEGYLTQSITNKTKYIDFLSREYTGDDIVEQKWRGHRYWVPYTEEQLTSAIEVVKYLLSEFKIKNYVMSHNTKVDDIYNIHGVTYKSNFNTSYTDVSPAWDFKNFKLKVENDD